MRSKNHTDSMAHPEIEKGADFDWGNRGEKPKNLLEVFRCITLMDQNQRGRKRKSEGSP